MRRRLRALKSHIPTQVFVLHAVVFLALLWWSWRKWPDPLADFGRELYIPWQLSHGKLLYRDVASLFGPLSPYLNAVWMRLFGVSLITIAVCNAAIFAAIIAGVHHFIRVATDKFTATVASLTALALCGFCQYIDVGNYNFITPYSHEATHGLALGVLVLILIHRGMASSRPLLGAPAGLPFGLLLMTKTEVPVAISVAICVGLLGYASLGRTERRNSAVMMAAFCIGSIVGPALFYAYFRIFVGQSQAIRSVGAAWLTVLNPAIITNQFYWASMGIDRTGRSVALMALLFVVVVATIAGAVAMSSITARKGSRAAERKHWYQVAMLSAVPLTQLLPFGRIFPLVTIAALLAAGTQFWKHRRNADVAARHLALMMWCAFATAMLGKIILDSRIYHYGFYLALPAVTVAVISLCAIIPALLERWRPGPAAREFRLVAAFAVGAAVLADLGLSQGWYATKRLPIGSGGDRFYVSSSGTIPEELLLRDALQTLTRYTNENDTIAVMPEGVMLNYLLRVNSPLRVVTLMPPEVLAFGEAAVVDSLEAAPPTFVVYVHKDTSEYGFPLFGTERWYGEQIMTWVKAHYQPVQTFGREPLSPAGYGIEILRMAGTARTSPR
jgi:hypothetical protein